MVCKVLMVARWNIFKFWWYNQFVYVNEDLMKSGLKQLIFSALYTYGKDMLYLSCLFYLNSFISHTLCSTQGHCERYSSSSTHECIFVDDISLTISLFSDLDLSYYQMLLYLILSWNPFQRYQRRFSIKL